MPKRHLIIGSSAASIGALSRLRALVPDDEIICLTAQKEMPYNTCLLADFLCTGKAPETLWTKTADFFSKNNIRLNLGSKVESINPDTHTVTTQDGTTERYDTLFIGTGTSQRWLPTPQPATSGLFGFQTLHDAQGIDTFIRTHTPRTALVIGAGLSGVECADALTERGVQVTVLEYGTTILPTLINAPASSIIAECMKAAGTTIHTQTAVDHIMVNANGAACGAVTASGVALPADMVVVAIGATINSTLAHHAGITLDQSSIVVDHHMRTSHDSIFAGGDVASVPTSSGSHARSCTWPDAMQQGMFAARAMSGAEKQYPGMTTVLSSHFYDTQFVSCGPVITPPSQYIAHEKQTAGSYRLLLTHGNKLKGFLMIGPLTAIGTLRRMVKTQEEVTSSQIKALLD